MNAILALDQGTTSSRGIVFNHDGSIRAVAQQEFQQIFPQAGSVEHGANEISRAQLETARAAIAKAGLTARDIAAIGIRRKAILGAQIRNLIPHFPPCGAEVSTEGWTRNRPFFQPAHKGEPGAAYLRLYE